MRLDITGRHVDITPPLRQLIERRLARLERLLNDSIVSIKVILTLEKYRHRAEVIVHARGDHTLRGLGEGNAWPISLRQAVEKLEQQADKVKTKWTERKRSDARRRVPRVARETRTWGPRAAGALPRSRRRWMAPTPRTHPPRGSSVPRAMRSNRCQSRTPRCGSTTGRKPSSSFAAPTATR